MTEEIKEKKITEETFDVAIEQMKKDYSKPLTQEEQTEFNKKIMGMVASMGQEIENLIIVLQSLSTMETMKVMGQLVKSFSEATIMGEELTEEKKKEKSDEIIYS